MRTDEITADKILDSRDIIARHEELTDERESLAADLESAKEDHDANHSEVTKNAVEATADALATFDDTNGPELKALAQVIEDCEGYGDFTHGEALIREDHFEEYARDLAEDLGLMENCDKWPFSCIDWEKAADELRQDYTETEFLGHTYYMRS